MNRPTPLLRLTLAMTLSMGALACAPAGADEQAAPGQHVSVALGEAFAIQHESVLDEMRPGGRYAEITPEERREVLGALQAMEEVLHGREQVEDLSPEERVLVFNAQAIVNTRLTLAAEQSREVCRRERKVGTHFRTTVCNTVAEWTRQLEDAQDDMRMKQRGTKCTQGNTPSICAG